MAGPDAQKLAATAAAVYALKNTYALLRRGSFLALSNRTNPFLLTRHISPDPAVTQITRRRLYPAFESRAVSNLATLFEKALG
jgi:hypothetical protein